MLIEVFGENFGCFRDEFRLSMVAAEIEKGSDRGIVEVKVKGEKKLRLLRMAAIYGANASGKSTILEAVGAIHSLLLNWMMAPREGGISAYKPHAAGDHNAKPCRLGLAAVIGEQIFEYSIEFNASEILSERLTRAESLDDEPVELLVREQKTVTGQWMKDSTFELLVQDFPASAPLLYLTSARLPAHTDQIGENLVELLGRFIGPRSTLSFADAGRMVEADADFRSWLIAHLSAADVGISDLWVTKREEPALSLRIEPEASSRKVTRYQFEFEHQGGESTFRLPMTSESEGTKRMVALAPHLHAILQPDKAGTLWVDELDMSLHPALLRAVVDHLNRSVPKEHIHSQMVFTTHDINLLEGEARDAALRRDQVYFTEKNADGSSTLFSLADFSEREVVNLRKRYMEGRYGALPILGPFSIPDSTSGAGDDE